MLQKLSDVELVILNFFLVLNSLLLKLLLELIDFLFFLVENLILLLFTRGVLFLEICVDFFDVLLVCINHLLHIELILLQLFELDVILFYSILESFSGFVRW